MCTRIVAIDEYVFKVCVENFPMNYFKNKIKHPRGDLKKTTHFEFRQAWQVVSLTSVEACPIVLFKSAFDPFPSLSLAPFQTRLFPLDKLVLGTFPGLYLTPFQACL